MEEKAKQQLPTRAEIPAEYKWAVEDLYTTDEAWETDLAKLKETISQLAAYQGRLGNSVQELLAALRLRDAVGLSAERLYCYAYFKRDEDTTNQKYQAMADRAARVTVQAGAASAYFNPEILAIPAGRLAEWLEQTPELGVYRHFLDDLARYRPHTLSEQEERLLALGGEVAEIPGNVFTMLNNADINFGTIQDDSGQEVEVTHGRYLTLMEHPDRRVRRDAFIAIHSAYLRQKNTLAALLNGSVKKDIYLARVRNFPTALAAALHEENIPSAVYSNLIDTIHKYLNVHHHYMGVRRRILGLDSLHAYDVYTPLVQEGSGDIPYRRAVEMMLEALAPLGQEYLGVLQQGMADRWVDVYENRGKRSGAYSWGTYDTHPFVLLNYQGRLNDVSTLVHEMGHALHSHFSNHSQPYVDAKYSIFVAEVASTVNEVLLVRHLLAGTTDQKQRLFLLDRFLNQFNSTIFRQVMFAEFEQIIHHHVEQGDALTQDFLRNTYRDLNIRYFGPEFVIDDELTMGWARIPHFYRAFYVYKYATGFASAIALCQQILEEGPPAVQRYMNFLRAGNSVYPLDALRQAGVDLTTPQPIEAAMEEYAKLVEQLAALA